MSSILTRLDCGPSFKSDLVARVLGVFGQRVSVRREDNERHFPLKSEIPVFVRMLVIVS